MELKTSKNSAFCENEAKTFRSQVEPGQRQSVGYTIAAADWDTGSLQPFGAPAAEPQAPAWLVV